MSQETQKTTEKEKEQIYKQEQKKEILDFEELLKNIDSFWGLSSQELKDSQKFQELTKDWKFWNTQPVLEPNKEITTEQGALIPKRAKEELQQPTKLPDNCQWVNLDLTQEQDIQLIYTLLYENYVEDTDGCFRFNYSKDFLQWALMHPNFKQELFFGILTQNNELIGFISGIVLETTLENKVVPMTEVNFLCVRKENRKNYLASLLIKELVRRSNLINIWQGIYTSGTLLPTPFSQARYYHWNLNYKKLVEVGFTSQPLNQRHFQMLEKLYELQDQIELPQGYTLRPTEEKDINQVRKLLEEYLKRFKVYVNFSKKEAAHWFIRRKNIIESYVIEHNNKITDFLSFYCIPSSVLKNEKHKEIKIAYAYYMVNNSLSLKELFKVALILAKKNNYDVFNCLNIMENEQAFEQLNFMPGDGYLNYYLYNWKLKETIMSPSNIGIVLM